MSIFPAAHILDVNISTSFTQPIDSSLLSIARLPTDPIYYADLDYTNFQIGSSYKTIYNDIQTVISTGTVAGDFTISNVSANDAIEVIVTKARKYGYKEYGSTIAHSRAGAVIYGAQVVDSNVTEANETTVANYVGYNYDAINNSFTVPALETITRAYDYGIYSASLLANIDNDYPLSTVAGTSYTIATGWTLKLFDDLGGVSLSGNVELQTVSNLTNFHVSGRVTFTAAGTYTLDNTTITEVINASGGNITISLTNGSAITTNLSPATITILEPKQVTFTGLIAGSDVTILQAGTNTVLANVDQEQTSSWSYSNNSTIIIDIGINKAGYKPLYIYNYVLNTANAIYPITQIPDRNYN